MAKITRIKYWWVEAAAETCIIIAALYYVFSSQFSALVTWEVLAFAYLVAIMAVVWKGDPTISILVADRKFYSRWSGFFTLLSSAVGVNAAIWALAAKAKHTGANAEIGVVASLGVVLSWMLLQIGFAQIYEILDAQRNYAVFDYPGKEENEDPVLMDYLYFSFTIGASFATSDVNVKHAHGRRVVLLHSILSFFYNALVVAVAFQVIQDVVA